MRLGTLAGLMAVLALAVLIAQASPNPPHIDVRVPTYDEEYAQRKSPSAAQEGDSPSFAFVVTADMRNYTGSGQYNTSQYFRGAVEAIAALDGTAFMVSPGDFDPPIDTLWTITQTMGAEYTWYPVVGNHELPGAGQEANPGENMNWLRNYHYGAVNPGPMGCPTTTYSFDYNNAHFVMLNEYCDVSGDDVTTGDVPDHLYNWLVNDLNSTDKEYVFIFGHEPAYPQADTDNGRTRHVGDSLDQYPTHRVRFWDLLRNRGVMAYICGHTHNHSALQIDGVWQLDVGHARGLGDTGARSTFVMIYIYGDEVRFETYRDDGRGGPYTRMHTGFLYGAEYLYLPLAVRNWL